MRSVSINCYLISLTDTHLNIYSPISFEDSLPHPKKQDKMQSKINDTFEQPGLDWQTEEYWKDGEQNIQDTYFDSWDSYQT